MLLSVLRVLAPTSSASTLGSDPQVASTAIPLYYVGSPGFSTVSAPASGVKEVTLIDTSVSSPLIGSRLEVNCLVNNSNMLVLLDTGSPTSIVSSSLVQRYGWSTYTVPPLKWKGAISSSTSTTSTAVKLSLVIKGIKVRLSAYVSPDLTDRIIIGYPVLVKYPTLLSPTVYTIDILQEECDTISTLYDDVDEVFCLSLASSTASDSFSLLPAHFTSKFSTTVTDTLSPGSGTKSYNHEIILKEGGRPPRLNPYRLTPKLEQECHKIIDDLLKKGFIVNSKSPVSSPMLLVKKKDGTYRLVIDYRQLNKVTIKDPFPLPRIDDLMAKIGDCSVFSTLDLHSGYHQIPLEKDSQELTAFTTPSGHYHYKVMPFGLCNAPATFSRYMNRLLGIIPHVYVYLDDILIASNNKQQHLKDLDKVLSILQKEGLVCKKSKCHFLQEKVEFLGHELSSKGFSVQQDKVKAIKQLPLPKDIKACQSFVGMVNYYRTFIPDCSNISRPLINFISKKEQWSDKQTKAVETLKEKLINAPILIPFVSGKDYRLTTDASIAALGAVLERLENNKVIGVIGYFSKSVNKTQANYSIGEIELLAIIEALQHFRYYLHGHKFTIRTDHISLLSLRNKTEPSKRLTRWLDTLAEYDFDLEYIKGTNNFVADTLSRPSTINLVEAYPMVTLDTIKPETWYNSLLTDPWSAAVMVKLGFSKEHSVSAGNMSLYKKYFKKVTLSRTYAEHFTFDNRILKYDARICVPATEQYKLLEIYHDSFLQGGHFGETTTINKIQPLYYWPNMNTTIKEYIKSCIQCQVMKAYRPKSQGTLMPLPIAKGRWLNISIDFISGIPTTFQNNDMIMVVVDRFSKRAHFIATNKTLTSDGVLQLFYRYIFAYHGFPQTIVSDRDIRFVSSAYKELTSRLGITLHMSSSNHPQTDGQTESINKTLGRLLRSYCSTEQQHWDRFLPHIEFVYNSTYQGAIKGSPFEIDLGFTPNEPLLDTTNELSARNFNQVEIAKRLKAITLRTNDQLQERQAAMEVQENPHRQSLEFQVGEFVLLHRDAYFTGEGILKYNQYTLVLFK